MVTQASPAEESSEESVFLFGSFSEDEANYFQSLEISSVTNPSTSPAQEEIIIDGHHPQERVVGPIDPFRDLGVSSSGAGTPSESSHMCSVPHPTQEGTPEKEIAEVRPSDGPVPVQHVDEWGHGDRRHPQPDNSLSIDPSSTQYPVPSSDQYPPVVDKLPLPQIDQPPPHALTPGPITSSSDSIPDPSTTPPVGSAVPQPSLQGGNGKQQGQAPVEPPAPPAVKKPPSSWAALLASSAPAPAPGPRQLQPGTPTVAPRQPSTAPVVQTTTAVPAPAPGVAASRAAPTGAPSGGRLGADSAAPVTPTPAPSQTASTPLPTNSWTPAPAGQPTAETAQSQDVPPRAPRGFINRGNLCFANATLQALAGSSSFGHLLDDLRQHPEKRRGSCPTVGSVLKLWETLCRPAPGQPSPQNPQLRGVQPPQGAPSGLPQNGTGPASQGGKAASQGGAGKGAQGAGGAPSTNSSLAKTGRSTPQIAQAVDAALILEGVLSRFSPQHHTNGVQIRQEDAQEFLSYLLDRMHEELCPSYRVQSTVVSDAPLANGDLSREEGAHSGESSAAAEDFDAGGWETVGVKNRTAVTRQHALAQSDVSDLFFGKLRSEIKTRGVKASATVQPFSVLQLDISRASVRSVEDALLVLSQAEIVEGYRPEEKPGHQATSASKVVKIQDLPRVLVLHLMRFNYNTRGSVKVHKPITFPFKLEIPRDLVYAPAAAASPLATKEGRTYRLFATVVHHGKDPSRGHYTADVRQGEDSWLRFDDASVFPVPSGSVGREQVYLLMYERVN